MTYPDIFKEVEESIYWQMEFPYGAVADCSTSYTSYSDYLMAAAENGHFELSPAISYGPFIGKSSNGSMDFPETNQQQVQMDSLAPYFLNNKPLPDHISGLEGLKDLRVIDAIYKAARSGTRVLI